MKDIICNVLEILFLIGMILCWVFVRFTGSDLIAVGVCILGFIIIEAIIKTRF